MRKNDSGSRTGAGVAAFERPADPTQEKIITVVAAASARNWRGKKKALEVGAFAIEALSELEREHLELFDRIPAGIYRATPDGKVLDCNRAFALTLGYDSKAEVLGLPDWRACIVEEDRIPPAGQDVGCPGFESFLKRKDGTPVWVLRNEVLISVPPDAPPFIAGLIVDVTDRKHAEERALEAVRLARSCHRAASELLANVLRETRQTLARIACAADHALLATASQDKRSNLSNIKSDAERLMQYLRELPDPGPCEAERSHSDRAGDHHDRNRRVPNIVPTASPSALAPGGSADKPGVPGAELRLPRGRRPRTDLVPPLRILLVEDYGVDQLVTRKLLAKWGHVVDVASNGREALDLLAVEPFDFVIMDVHLPEMNGLETAMAIRRSEGIADSHIPILAMTSRGTNVNLKECIQAGMDGQIARPIHAEDLEESIRRLVVGSGRECRAAAVPSPRRGALDRHVILRRVEGDIDLLTKLVALFLSQTGNLMQEIRAALASGDCKGILLASGALKEAISYFATGAAFEAAHRLEAAGRLGRIEAAAREFDRLEQELGQLRSQVAGMVEEELPCAF